MAKTISNSDVAAIEAVRRAAAKAEAMYQFTVCSGLALVAAFVGTAGALMMHNAI